LNPMNISGLLQAFDELDSYADFKERLLNGSGAYSLDLSKNIQPALLARLFLELRRPILLISGKVESVPAWQQSLSGWLPADSNLLRFPEPTPLPYERGPWSDRSRFGRLVVLRKLVESQHPLIKNSLEPVFMVTSARALLHKTLPKRRFISALRVLRKGQLVDLESLLSVWNSSGYEPVSVVDKPGQYSKRGGIVDIFPVGAMNPSRVELYGDEIDTIRIFDPATQRSIKSDNRNSDYIIVPPARELLLEDAKFVGDSIGGEFHPALHDIPSWRDDIRDLQKGRLTDHLEYYLSMAYSHPSSLIDYLPENALIVTDDLAELKNGAFETHHHASQIADEQDGLPPGYRNPLFGWESISKELSTNIFINLGSESDSIQTTNLTLDTAFRPGPQFGGQIRPFLRHLKISKASGDRIVVVSQQSQRLADLWAENGRSYVDGANRYGKPVVDAITEYPEEGTLTFVQGTITGGFFLEREGGASSNALSTEKAGLVNLLTDTEIFGWSRPAPRRRIAPRPIAPESFFADIQPGDFVVHSDFGIGRFINLVVRTIGGTEREYLQVDFANGDALYVPVHHADRLSRWTGPDDRNPRLHRLGEKKWRKTKSRAQKAVDELADELLELYASRETIAGHAFTPDSQWQAELEAGFPYTETVDQLSAIEDVKADMERAYPMDRLICGDVGYGKTEVALRAAFKAVMDGKQVAMLVPTTVLAQQHFNTFRERLRPYPVNVEMLSRFRTPSQQEEILRQLRKGKVDIVIGTHRLLSDDVSFKDLGLLFIDEEQRFGVAHKEKLKQIRTEVDVLTMTATPIPRTLYMSLVGVRDISQIDTAPADRLPVQTYVGESEDTILRQAILREIDRGGQVFYVHNRVQSIDNIRLKLSFLVPETTVAVGHGQMSERELEEVMIRFVDGSIDVLLSTSIIESGLDIPNANTLIVDRADQFGLAQLYQLRGRVGRGIRRAYSYFLHPPWHHLTADAKARLEVIASQTDLGAGYSIAMRDLEIRGAGDLLGSRQSGHIAAIGFDLYMRLLTEAVKKRRAVQKGEPTPPDLSEALTIDLPIAAYIPTDYVPDASLRLRLYRRMAVLATLNDIDEMAAELADRFGAIPDPVDNLLFQLRIKILASEAGIAAVGSESGQVQIRLPGEEAAGGMRLQRYLGQDIRVSRQKIWLARGLSTRQWQVALVQVLEKLQSYER